MGSAVKNADAMRGGGVDLSSGVVAAPENKAARASVASEEFLSGPSLVYAQSDAVVLKKSSNRTEVGSTGSEDPKTPSSTSGSRAAEDVEQAAKQLENIMNRTAVQFRVSLTNNDNTLNFRVVDIKTGKVIREFPQGEMPELIEKATRASNGVGGMFVDSAA